MMYKRIFFVILIAVLSQGCNDFYSYSKVEDIWRLPLVEPYELQNTVTEKPTYSGVDEDWYLKLYKLKVDSISKHLNISMVNVDKNLIYGYGENNPSCHFIINCNNNTERVFKDTMEWRRELKNMGADPDSVKNVWNLFKQFQDNGDLPWRREK